MKRSRRGRRQGQRKLTFLDCVPLRNFRQERGTSYARGHKNLSVGADRIGGQMRPSRWQGYGESASSSQYAFDGDHSAVKFGKLLHQGKPYARPLKTPPSRTFDAVEAMKNEFEFFRGNARARVFDRQLNVTSEPSQSHANGPF